MTLDEVLKSERSLNLNALRLLLAGAVIISHAWPLALGPSASEPLEQATGRSLGGWAVGAFFFISGMLITASAERKAALPFCVARFRRIVPGLGAALLVTLALALACGANASVPDYAFWFVRSLTLVSIEHRIAGAFADNPIPLVVNGPLWSLFHEVVAYVICAAFVWLGGARSWPALLALVMLALALCVFHYSLSGRLATFAPLFLAFVLGMVAYLLRRFIDLTLSLGAGTMLLAAILPWWLGLGFAGFALVVLALCAPSFHLRDDLSYGMYIYGWPVAQTLVALSPGLGPSVLAIWSLLLTVPFAMASWWLVERPALRFRRAAV